jgi:hypothetical protein
MPFNLRGCQICYGKFHKFVSSPLLQARSLRIFGIHVALLFHLPCCLPILATQTCEPDR